MSDTPSDLKACYSLLDLSPSASLEDLDNTYFRLKAQKISQGLRQEIPALKAAYQRLKSHLQEQLYAQSDATTSPLLIAESHQSSSDRLCSTLAGHLQTIFTGKNIKVHVHLSGHQLLLQLMDAQVPHPSSKGKTDSAHHPTHSVAITESRTVAQLHTWLKNNVSQMPGLSQFQSVKISAHSRSSRPLWTQTIPMPGAEATFADHDLTSFHSRLVQLFGFPGLLLIAVMMNGVSSIRFLLRGITIWFHEFGHATVAWLSGRKALPLPFGWTNVEPTKSLFVYLGILVLLGLMGWAGYREKRRWPMVLAIALAVLQFLMTWLMPTQTFEMLLSFGGIGGEFYLCTLLIVSFFFPLPNYFRWDIYRYPAVLGASFTFSGSFSLWRQIDRGQQSIPWGSLWGGADHQGGDMNQLSAVHGWSDQQIIDTYNTLSGICLSLVIGVYLFFVWKNQRSHLMLFWHQFKASYWK